MFLSRNKKNNVYPYKPQFYYIKLGFKGVKIIWVCFRDVLLFFQENIGCGYSFEGPHWGPSNEYPQHIFFWRNKKNMNIFFVEKSTILELQLTLGKSLLHMPARK